MRLLGVELIRLRSRRAYWVVVLLALAGVLLALGSSINDSRPPSAGEIAAAEAQLEQELQQPFYQEEFDRCEEELAGGVSSNYPPGFDCEEMLPQLEWFLSYDEPRFVQDLREFLPASALMLAMAGALVGATFVGADWSAGTIGTHLLFEPRRGRVFASKAVAVAIGLSLPAVVGFGAGYLGTWYAASAWGSTALEYMTYEPNGPTGEMIGVMTPVSWLDLGILGLRALGFVALAGLGGYVLAMAFRSSLGAVGTVAAYGLVGEGLVRAVWSGAEPWLLSNRVAAWLMGGHEIVTYPDPCAPDACEPEIIRLSTLDGGFFLTALLVVGLAGSYLLFRRRDVT